MHGIGRGPFHRARARESHGTGILFKEPNPTGSRPSDLIGLYKEIGNPTGGNGDHQGEGEKGKRKRKNRMAGGGRGRRDCRLDASPVISCWILPPGLGGTAKWLWLSDFCLISKLLFHK